MIVSIADESVPVASWKKKINGWADMTTAERRAAKWAILSRMDTTALETEAQRRMKGGITIAI